MRIHILKRSILVLGLCFAGIAHAAPGQLFAPSPVPDDGYGTSVALDNAGTEMLVGASPVPYGVSANASKAYLYALTGGQWQLISTLTCNQGSDIADVALSEDGNTAMVSGPDGACLYRAAGAGWAAAPSVMATFSVPPAEDLAVALSADGNTALVGAPAGGPGGTSGVATLYQAAAGTWAPAPTPVATFSVSGNTELGAAVALSSDGDTALVTDPLAGNAPGCVTGGNGVAYVYRASGGLWAPSPSPTATLAHAQCQRLGRSAAISSDGNIVLLGAPQFSNAGVPAGAYIFEAASGTWAMSPSPTAYITGGVVSPSLGQSVALSADGQTALLGDATDNFAEVVESVNGSWPGAPVPGVQFMGNQCTFAYSLALAGNGLSGVAGAPSCPANTAGSVFTTAVAAPVYAAPTVSNGSLSVAESMSATGMLAATPASASDTLSFSIASHPMHGSVVLDSAVTGAYTYTAAMGYSGADSFTFTAADNQNSLTSGTGKVSISVTQPGGSGGGAFAWFMLGLMSYLIRMRRRSGV